MDELTEWFFQVHRRAETESPFGAIRPICRSTSLSDKNRRSQNCDSLGAPSAPQFLPPPEAGANSFVFQRDLQRARDKPHKISRVPQLVFQQFEPQNSLSARRLSCGNDCRPGSKSPRGGACPQAE